MATHEQFDCGGEPDGSANLTGHPTTTDDRRGAPRRPTRWPGWVSKEMDVWEVVMIDTSETGAGFLSPVKLEAGQVVHLKVGVGPARRYRGVRVAYARPRPEGGWRVGVMYIDE